MRLVVPGYQFSMLTEQEIAHYLNYIKEFWFSLVNDAPASVVKIDQHTVETLQLMAPHAEASAVHGLVVSGQVFSEFNENERLVIWEKLRSFDGLIPSLYSFFEDFKCFESWTHCLSRLFTVEKSTVRKTMESLYTRSTERDGTVPIQISELSFSDRIEPPSRHFELAYRQIWLYAMRHYPQMPRDPKREGRLAKAQNATADEYAVSDMADLARRLRFQFPEITDLVNSSPDRLIAKQALLRARKPDRYSYDDSIFDALIDRIVDCFSKATPKNAERPPPVLVNPSVKRKARCGHPTIRALLQDRPLLFIGQMQSADVPDGVTIFL